MKICPILSLKKPDHPCLKEDCGFWNGLVCGIASLSKEI